MAPQHGSGASLYPGERRLGGVMNADSGGNMPTPLAPDIPTDSAISAAPPVLTYATPASRWQRCAGRAYRALAFLLVSAFAGAVTLVFLAVLPLVAVWLAYIVYAVHQVGSDHDVASPRELVVVSGILHTGGVILSILVILAGVLVDLVRRLFRRGWWLTLGIVVALMAVSMVVTTALYGLPLKQIASVSITSTAALTALFCVYWIPLGIAELLRRVTESTGRKIWKLWQSYHSGPATTTAATAAPLASPASDP